MANLNVFNNSAFSLTSLSAAVEQIDYSPQYLGNLGVFEPKPVRSKDVFVDRRSRSISIIPTTERGAAPSRRESDSRDAINFSTVRLAKADRITALEVADIRQFGSESEFEQVQAEVARRSSDLVVDMETTHEFHRLGAVQGKLLDADGVTIIEDYFQKFGVAEPTAINFALTTDTTDVRSICHSVVRSVERGAKGSWTPSARVHALAGDTFFDNLIKHPSVRDTYLYQEGRNLREGMAFGMLDFGGIVFHNYRGTDDGSSVAIAANEACFFPVGARGIFQKAMAPANEFAPYVGALGQNVYAMTIQDNERQAWVDIELYSYPLFMCTRPETLQKAVGNA